MSCHNSIWQLLRFNKSQNQCTCWIKYRHHAFARSLLVSHLHLIPNMRTRCRRDAEHHSSSTFRNMSQNKEILLVGARTSGAVRHRPALSPFLFIEKPRLVRIELTYNPVWLRTRSCKLIAIRYHRAQCVHFILLAASVLYFTRSIFYFSIFCSILLDPLESPGEKWRPVNSALLAFKSKALTYNESHEMRPSI